jgi:hypothetical protein
MDEPIANWPPPDEMIANRKRDLCSKPRCRAPIFWALTVNGKAIPIDYEPVANGNLIICASGPHPMRLNDACLWVSHWIEIEDPHGEQLRFVSHCVTCPAAEQFRR